MTLIVCCSWVQFWLTKTEKGGEVAARTSLGATTVLTVVTIGLEGNNKPQVKCTICIISEIYVTLFFILILHKLIYNLVDAYYCLTGRIRNGT